MLIDNPASAQLDLLLVHRLCEIERSRPGFLPKLLDSFRRNQRRFVDSAEALLATDDRERLRAGAHTLKGSAASLGAARLAALAGQVESIAIAGDRDAVAAMIARMREEFEPSVTALNEACSRMMEDLNNTT